MKDSAGEVVAEFYEAGIDPAGWRGALQRIAGALGADACGIVRRRFPKRDGLFLHAVGIEQPAVEAYNKRCGRDDVWLADERLLQQGHVFTSTELDLTGSLADTPFHREWLAATDFAQAVFCVLHRVGQTATLFAAYRRTAVAAFNGADVALLCELAPRLGRAFRLGLDVGRQSAERRAALDVLDVLPIGVVTLDGNGVMLRANRYAQTILAAGEGISRNDGSLVLERPGSRIKLRDVLAHSQSARVNGVTDVALYTVPRYRQQRPLTCLITVLDRGDPAIEGAQAILFIGDPERMVAFEPTRLTWLYGLSRAEARVASLLARGQRLEEIAEALGIAYETVRKHLKQIFIKTGVSRQAELVRILVTGPAGLAVGIGFATRDPSTVP